jgi:hypothetical protein
MLGFVRSLRSVAEAADAGLAKTGRRPEKLADCLDKLRKLFQAAQQASGSSKAGYIFICMDMHIKICISNMQQILASMACAAVSACCCAEPLTGHQSCGIGC